MPRTRTQFLLAFLIVAVVAAHPFYLWKVRTSVPHQDEWTGLDQMFQAQDSHRTFEWLLSSHNGHFGVPAALSYFVALKFFALDLKPIRFLNFAICSAAFILAAAVIHAQVRHRALRYYLYLGVSLITFNLCLWEHFAQAGAFTAVLSTLLSGIGIYGIARSTQSELNQPKNAAIGTAFLVGAILSFGTGYVAVAAAVALFAIATLKFFMATRAPRWMPRVLGYGLAGLIAVAALSHPMLALKAPGLANIHHIILVAGSIGAFPFEGGEMALNAGYFFGMILIALMFWSIYHFVIREPARARLLPTFALGLVMFGLFCCIAVAAARSRLPAGEFLSSRYTLYPSICFLGLLLYFAHARLFLLGHVWCLIAVGYLFATVKEQQVGRYRPAVYAAIENAMRNIDNMSDDQLRGTLYWQENTAGIRRVTARLRGERLNIFHENH